MKITKFVKANGAELSAISKYIVITGNDGQWRFADAVGGRFSRSGLTQYPMWIEEGSIYVGPAKELTANYIRSRYMEEPIYCLLRGQVTFLKTWKLKKALGRWLDWRTSEFDSRHPEIESDEELVAAIVSYQEARYTNGSRLTEHEVYREAESLLYDNDSNRWIAMFPDGWKAERDDLSSVWSQIGTPGTRR